MLIKCLLSDSLTKDTKITPAVVEKQENHFLLRYMFFLLDKMNVQALWLLNRKKLFCYRLNFVFNNKTRSLYIIIQCKVYFHKRSLFMWPHLHSSLFKIVTLPTHALHELQNIHQMLIAPFCAKLIFFKINRYKHLTVCVCLMYHIMLSSKSFSINALVVLPGKNYIVGLLHKGFVMIPSASYC